MAVDMQSSRLHPFHWSVWWSLLWLVCVSIWVCFSAASTEVMLGTGVRMDTWRMKGANPTWLPQGLFCTFPKNSRGVNSWSKYWPSTPHSVNVGFYFVCLFVCLFFSYHFWVYDVQTVSACETCSHTNIHSYLQSKFLFRAAGETAYQRAGSQPVNEMPRAVTAAVLGIFKSWLKGWQESAVIVRMETGDWRPTQPNPDQTKPKPKQSHVFSLNAGITSASLSWS